MATSETTSGAVAGRRLRDRAFLAHWALFVALLVAGVANLLGHTFLIGAPLASAVLWPAAALLLGIAACRRDHAATRPILLAASIVAFIVGAAELVSPDANRFLDPPGGLVPATIAAAVAVVAIVAALTLNRGDASEGSRIVRTAADRATGLVLVVLGLVAVGVLLTNALGRATIGSVVDGLPFVFSFVATDWIVAFVIGLVAWWWGSGWLLALSGLATIGAIVSVPLGSLTTAAIPATLLGIGSLVAGLRPPTGPPVGAPIQWRERLPQRPTIAAFWALAGSFLLIPTLLVGRFPPILEDCFDRCSPISPLAEPSAVVDVAFIVLVPAAALALAFAPSARPVANGGAALIGLAAGVLVIFQVVLGQVGTRPFVYMGFAAPAGLLVLIGFGAAAMRPAALAGTRQLQMLAITLLAVIWIAAGFTRDYGIVWPSHLGSVLAAGVAAVALAAAFGRTQPARRAEAHTEGD